VNTCLALRIVSQADHLNGIPDDTILLPITGSQYHIPDTEVLLDPVVETAAGLRKVCVVSCLNIMTYDQSLVFRTIGTVSAAVMQEVERCLKDVLEIP
jgi:mRNA-degrading endonuclease toxin of MazEF toxin-antitoxin module